MNQRISIITSAYRSEAFLPLFLESVAAQTVVDECELVICLNDPTQRELQILQGFSDRIDIRLLRVERERLAASTNRCIEAATGEYLALWNVDDLRFFRSLEMQRRALRENPDCELTYGDYYVVQKFGQLASDTLAVAPPFDAQEFGRSMHSGPFYMWRRGLSERIGGWDTRFERAGDFEWNLRAVRATRFAKSCGVLGAYLAVGGLSNTGDICRFETQVLMRKYGIGEKYGVYPDFPESEYLRKFQSYLDEDTASADELPPVQLHANYGALGPGKVLHNLQRGFEQAGIAFQVNGPLRPDALQLCLSGYEELRCKPGFADLGPVAVGPNVWPAEVEGAPVTCGLVPSTWVRDVWVARGWLAEQQALVWPVGIDSQAFADVRNHAKDIDCLVYFKNRRADELAQVERLLQQNEQSYRVLVCGDYSEQELKDLLQRSRYVFLLDGTESQGIAVLEMLSAGLPMFVWDVTTWTDWDGVDHEPATAVPYWSDECGLRETDAERLECSFGSFLARLGEFDGRGFVCRELSLRSQAEQLYELLLRRQDLAALHRRIEAGKQGIHFPVEGFAGELYLNDRRESHRWLASMVRTWRPRRILELGRRAGNSLFALAWFATDETVIDSYDIVDCGNVVQRSNVHIHVYDGDVRSIDYAAYDFVFVDINGDGVREQQVLQAMQISGFAGISLWDDIHCEQLPGLQRWWAELDLPKLDITATNHVSGSGLIDHRAVVLAAQPVPT